MSVSKIGVTVRAVRMRATYFDSVDAMQPPPGIHAVQRVFDQLGLLVHYANLVLTPQQAPRGSASADSSKPTDRLDALQQLGTRTRPSATYQAR